VNSPSLAALLFGRLGRRPEELVIRIRKTRTARPSVCRGC
jgi:hypothetical protein